MHNAYYLIAGAIILGIACMAWGLRHIGNPHRKHYIAEVGGMSCVLAGIFLGTAMWAFFGMANIDPALKPVTETTTKAP